MSASFSFNAWLTRLPRWFVIALAVPLFVLDAWAILLVWQYFQSVASALALATVLAFLLDYPVQFLQKQGIARPYAVGINFLLLLAILALIAITLVPVIVTQVEDLIQHLPALIDSSRMQLQAFQGWAAERRLPINMSGVITRLESLAPESIQSFSVQIPNVVLGAADSLLETILVLALTLYLLLHGKAFWNGVFRWLPGKMSGQIRHSLQQNFRNYFVGQATVAVIHGVLLSSAFFIIHLPNFLLFGMGIGLLVLVPFLDLVGALLVSGLVALSNVWLGLGVLAICLIVDQITDNAISPRIMGQLVGLNPVWIILSLLVGAKIAGFLGVILAIPLASTIQDVLEHLYPMPSEAEQPELIGDAGEIHAVGVVSKPV
jgi:predicted PurR-regulated permease PerM